MTLVAEVTIFPNNLRTICPLPPLQKCRLFGAAPRERDSGAQGGTGSGGGDTNLPSTITGPMLSRWQVNGDCIAQADSTRTLRRETRNNPPLKLSCVCHFSKSEVEDFDFKEERVGILPHNP